MSCDCDVMVGNFGRLRKVKKIEVNPSNSAYGSGEAIIVASPYEISNLFESDNGKAYITELTVKNFHSSAPIKKGMEFIFWDDKPSADMIAAINDAPATALGLTDFPKHFARAVVATADYVDAYKCSIARITFVNGLEVRNNNTTDDSQKRHLWMTILTTEAQTYGLAGLLSATIVFEF